MMLCELSVIKEIDVILTGIDLQNLQKGASIKAQVKVRGTEPEVPYFVHVRSDTQGHGKEEE